MRLVTTLVLVCGVSMLFLTGCPKKAEVQTPPTTPVGYQGPPPTPGDLTSEVPPGTGTGSSTMLPPSGDVGPGPVDTTGARSYTVKAHEGLMSIARTQLGNQHRWQEIVKMNPEIQAPDYRLKVGQVIKLPAK